MPKLRHVIFASDAVLHVNRASISPAHDARHESLMADRAEQVARKSLRFLSYLVPFFS